MSDVHRLRARHQRVFGDAEKGRKQWPISGGCRFAAYSYRRLYCPMRSPQRVAQQHTTLKRCYLHAPVRGIGEMSLPLAALRPRSRCQGSCRHASDILDSTLMTRSRLRLCIAAFRITWVILVPRPRGTRYWITSSAVANSVSGMVRPSALAVLRLMRRDHIWSAASPAGRPVSRPLESGRHKRPSSGTDHGVRRRSSAGLQRGRIRDLSKL